MMLAPWTLALVACLQSPAAPQLKPGAPAPAFQATSWLQGEPVFALEPGRAHLVVFWAPWSGASTQVFARLSEMAQRQAARGLSVTLVSGPDERAPTSQSSRARLVELASFARFRCAWDGEGALRRAWLDAAGLRTLPAAFLVDREGRLVACGAPQRVETLVQTVLDRRHDLAALERQAGERVARELRAARARAELQVAFRQRAWDKALGLCDELLAFDAAAHKRLVITRFQLLLRELGRVEEAYAYGESLLTGPLADDVGILTILAWTVVDPAQSPARRDLAFAGRCAQRAVDLTARRNATLLDTLARVHAAQGELAQAIALETEAARLDPFFERVLSEYQAAR